MPRDPYVFLGGLIRQDVFLGGLIRQDHHINQSREMPFSVFDLCSKYQNCPTYGVLQVIKRLYETKKIFAVPHMI